MPTYTVKSGDCISSIADRHGFFWKVLWDAPENASLKSERGNPNILMEGDEVFVPDKRVREESAGTDSRSTFRRKGVPSMFTLCLQTGGNPRADERYVFIAAGKHANGTTDAKGIISLPVPAGATSGILRMLDTDPLEEHVIAFGDLNPIGDPTGVQQRLNNLGFTCRVTGEIDAKTEEALARFQIMHGLDGTGALDSASSDKLVEIHGS